MTVLTVSEVADRLQVSEVTVRRLVTRGYLHRLPGLGALRIPSWSLEAYLDGRGTAWPRDDRPDQADADLGGGPAPLPGGGDDGGRPARFPNGTHRTRGGQAPTQETSL